MKIRVHFKTPDALYYALEETFTEEDTEEQLEQKEAAKTICEKFIQYGENIVVDIDTENWTARVVPVRP
jgi:hypothetical protein